MIQIVESQEEDEDIQLTNFAKTESSREVSSDEDDSPGFEPFKLSKIIVADDQDINLAVLKEFFGSLNVKDVTYCING